MSNIGCKIVTSFARPAKELVELFRDLPVSNIDDCMNRVCAVHGAIRPMNRAKLLGPAFTVKVPEGDNLMFHKALDMAEAGDVIVVDAGGMTNRAIFGELMVTYLRIRKVCGIIVDGSMRDYGSISQLEDFSVYARGISPNGPYKNGPGEINTTVSCGGIVVNPGDIVVGDEDGVVFIPSAEAAELAEKVRKVSAKEAQIIEEINRTGTYVRPWVDEKLREIGCETA